MLRQRHVTATCAVASAVHMKIHQSAASQNPDPSISTRICEINHTAYHAAALNFPIAGIHLRDREAVR